LKHDRTNTDAQAPAPALPVAPAATTQRRSYQPPSLTEKRALAEVTLFSGACTPGTPGCTIGHP
jgi:hypothetical protein